ncbi:MAG: hypothetical protein WDW36_008204 [Sanguina aurantia]
MKMALADFGEPLYGGTLMGQLVYLNPDSTYPQPPGGAPKCSPAPCNYACSPLNASTPPFVMKRTPGQKVIMLVDRGPSNLPGLAPCYFLDKVWNAQMAGADAVLVANDRPGDLTTAEVPESDDILREEFARLTVSAAMISLEDADFLKGFLKGPSAAPVSLVLNWTNILPTQKQVSWELWTNSNDECGVLCKEQKEFVKAMGPIAQALQSSNATVFTPHYMVWNCPENYTQTPECVSECINNGRYCSPDPDLDPAAISTGYSGKDVVLMNMRQLCIHKLATKAGRPGLWWDYVTQVGELCPMATNNYTAECSDRVVAAIGTLSLAEFHACADVVASSDPSGRIEVLERELDALSYVGADGATSVVSMIPSVRINGKLFRGSLDKAGVMRALCSAFPKDHEPSVCNEKWVSEDECAVDGPGWDACMTSSHSSNATQRNHCVNTFLGYSCECAPGWMRGFNSDGQEVCSDVNECTETGITIAQDACSCERCACINTIGSYRCTGPLPDMCTAENKFGGCWNAVVEGRSYNACVDTAAEYIARAAKGLVKDDSKWTTCKCPGCFYPELSATGQEGCLAACNLTDSCRGGVGGVSVFFIVLATIAATAGLMALAYHTVLRQRMGEEVKEIMSQYMPLEERGRMQQQGNGGGGGGPPSRPSGPARFYGSSGSSSGGGDQNGTGRNAGFAPPAVRDAEDPAGLGGSKGGGSFLAGLTLGGGGGGGRWAASPGSGARKEGGAGSGGIGMEERGPLMGGAVGRGSSELFSLEE